MTPGSHDMLNTIWARYARHLKIYRPLMITSAIIMVIFVFWWTFTMAADMNQLLSMGISGLIGAASTAIPSLWHRHRRYRYQAAILGIVSAIMLNQHQPEYVKLKVLGIDYASPQPGFIIAVDLAYEDVNGFKQSAPRQFIYDAVTQQYLDTPRTSSAA